MHDNGIHIDDATGFGPIRRWSGLILAILLLVGGAVFFAAGNTEWGLDDAYITYRYALNFVNGHGLVHNPGEYVEGYSTPLYVFVVAAGLLAVPPDLVYYWTTSVNVLAMIAALIVLHRVMRAHWGLRTADTAAILFSLFPESWRVMCNGMESSFVVLFHVLLWAALLRRLEKPGRGALVLLAIATILEVLIRVDGFVLPLAALVYLVIRRDYRGAAAVGGALFITLGALVAFRLAYYGYPLPNTYYVKISGALTDRVAYAWDQTRGLAMERGFLLYFVAAALVPVIALIRVITRDRHWRDAAGPTGILAAAWFAYWFYIGGDALGSRFLIAMVPLGLFLVLGSARYLADAPGLRTVVFIAFALWFFKGSEVAGRYYLFVLAPLVALALWSLRRQYPNHRVWLAAVFLLVAYIHLEHAYRFHQRLYPFEKRDGWIDLGRFLGERHPGETIATDAVGKIPYFSGLRTIDMYGLTDEYIAHLPPARHFVPGHNKVAPDYVLARQPDLIASWYDWSFNLPYCNITRKAYEDAGYRMAYIVSPAYRPEKHVVEVDPDWTDKEWESFRFQGYTYIVLVRDREAASE